MSCFKHPKTSLPLQLWFHKGCIICHYHIKLALSNAGICLFNPPIFCNIVFEVGHEPLIGLFYEFGYFIIWSMGRHRRKKTLFQTKTPPKKNGQCRLNFFLLTTMSSLLETQYCHSATKSIHAKQQVTYSWSQENQFILHQHINNCHYAKRLWYFCFVSLIISPPP